MKERILTPTERTRLKKIWQKAHSECATFDRYDMNFILSFINEDSDLVEQALDVKEKKK